MKSDYFEKLKDPRWQKKRLEIFERDGWKCKCCYSKQNTLNVHHILYSNKEPWEINNGFLFSVCEDCHSALKENKLDPDLLVNDIGDLLQAMWSNDFGTFDIINLTYAINEFGKPPQKTPDEWEFEINAKNTVSKT